MATATWSPSADSLPASTRKAIADRELDAAFRDAQRILARRPTVVSASMPTPLPLSRRRRRPVASGLAYYGLGLAIGGLLVAVAHLIGALL